MGMAINSNTMIRRLVSSAFSSRNRLIGFSRLGEAMRNKVAEKTI